MDSRKRTFMQALDEPTLTLRLADAGADDRPLVADRALLSVVSSCARGLPTDSAEWDLSGLLIEGQPVCRAVVVAWLNRINQHIFAEVFEQQEPNPAKSMSGLAQLLMFAVAVGTAKGPFAVCAQLGGLELKVQLGQQQLALEMDKCYFWALDESLKLERYNPNAQMSTVGAAASQEEKEACVKQVIQQTELLLYTAYKLQLPDLVDKMHALIQAFTAFCSSLLHGHLSSIFTARVMDAAGGIQDLLQRAFLNSIIARPCGLADGIGLHQVLRPIGLTAAQQAPIKFTAELLEDMLSGRKGEVVTVELDLFNYSLRKIGNFCWKVQLLAGHFITDESRERICGSSTL